MFTLSKVLITSSWALSCLNSSLYLWKSLPVWLLDITVLSDTFDHIYFSAFNLVPTANMILSSKTIESQFDCFLISTIWLSIMSIIFFVLSSNWKEISDKTLEKIVSISLMQISSVAFIFLSVSSFL